MGSEEGGGVRDKYWTFGVVRNLVFKKKDTKKEKEIKQERDQLKVMMA